MEEKLRLAICQMKVTENKEGNIQKAFDMIRTAAKNHIDMVLLPEMFICPYDNSKFEAFSEDPDDSPLLGGLSQLSKQHNIFIAAGTIPEKTGDRVYNTSFIFDREGKVAAKYSKAHLFDIDIPGRITFKESDVLSPGSGITTFDMGLCKVGVAICYDVRFPEFFKLMALRDVKLIILPASFNMVTGPAHWELLMRCRSVDNQVYIAAASAARDTGAGYVSYANSMVVDPWGTVTARAGEGEEIIYADIDLQAVGRIRNELPLLKNRRTDIYDLREI
ncbi:putative amidohydrolase [Anaerobacterium chartisolvens]|uniref:Putative amidohydrolase n=1 Tax=Anaerobacterium chartisolvens TaxID=1297424 RepID=A0A369BA28_9FIRM|nr:carbon-nitrogen hydrolase family protein [Anaerobacterium chartisolvens]RCX18389.1 putative amidohydrolase [Anaerobacterium chartisolvens]